MGLEWMDAEEDILGHVRAAGADCGYGAAVVVGAGGDDSDRDCELVVCVSDGLVWVEIEVAAPSVDCFQETGN